MADETLTVERVTEMLALWRYESTRYAALSIAGDRSELERSGYAVMARDAQEFVAVLQLALDSFALRAELARVRASFNEAAKQWQADTHELREMCDERIATARADAQRENETLKEPLAVCRDQAQAWFAVFDTLEEVQPGWRVGSAHAAASAVRAIREMRQRIAAFEVIAERAQAERDDPMGVAEDIVRELAALRGEGGA